MAINKFTGKKLWNYISEYPFIKGPAAANGIIYSCADSRPWIAGFNQMTGEKVFEDISQNYWNMIIADHGLYALSSSGVTIFKSKTNATTDNFISKNISITAYPNPATDEMTISYDIPETGTTRISLYDITGKEIIKLYDKSTSAGNHKLTLNVNDIQPGIYFIIIKNKYFIKSKKLVFASNIR